MREKIDRFSKGMFQWKRPELLISESQLSWSVTVGTDCEGSFCISSADGSRMTVFLLCEDTDMTLDCLSFEKEEKEIRYRYRTKRMTAGQKRSGQIRIISSLGEYSLPYEIWTSEPVCESSIGPVADLYQFEGLARGQWEEARELFFSPSFVENCLEESGDRLLYQGLCRSSSADQAMEEFLRVTRKKAPVMLKIEKNELEYHLAGKAMKDTIRIQKQGWGWLSAQLQVESVGGNFLRLEKQELSNEDFTAGVCELPLVLDPELLTGERGSAQVRIVTPDQTLVIAVTLYGVAKGRRRGAAVSKRKNYERRLYENYLQYQQGKISLAEYESGYRAILYGLQVLGEDSEWLAEYPVSWPQQWIREKMTPSEGTGWDARAPRPEERIKVCREWFAEGKRSPLLYQEAWLAFQEAPELLTRLEDFEVQMMNWARKQDLWEESLVSRYVYLTESSLMFVRPDQKLVYYYLKEAYAKKPDTEILNALCLWLLRLHARGARQSREFHEWYRKGVEQGLRLTGLFEAYMETLELVAGTSWGITDNTFPDTRVYTYFLRDNRLDSQKKANLYAHIIRQKERRPAVYQNYREQMWELALRQLNAGKCSEALAVIYQDLLEQEDFRRKVLTDLPKVIFDTRIRCKEEGIRGVWIWNAGEEEELFAPMDQGQTCVEIYTQEACILLEDEHGWRWASSHSYEKEGLMRASSWLEACYEAGSRDRRLMMALADGLLQNKYKGNHRFGLMQEMMELRGLTLPFRQEILNEVIRCCQDEGKEGLLEHYLKKFDLRRADPQRRVELINRMLQQEMWDLSEGALRQYGWESVDQKQMLRMISHKTQDESLADDFLIEISWNLFEHGLYDRYQLEYLVQYFEGSLDQLCHLWKIVKSYGLPTGSLEERILEQQLFTEESCDLMMMTEVYLAFREKVDRERRGDSRKLLRAYLAYRAYRYLTVDWPVEEELVRQMKEEVFYDDTLLCKVAVLKYFSMKQTLTADEADFAERQMERLAAQGKILPFFQAFAGKCRIPAGIRHQQYVMYVGEPGETVEIHHRMLGEKESAWSSEWMPEVFYGIHVKGFVLFRGEQVQYQVAEEEMLTLSWEEQGPKQEAQDGYELLNDILAAREEGRIAEQIQLMEQYLQQEQMKEILFQPMGLK